MVSLTEQADFYARRLSGGMRRRLLVAKAMVHSPPILVLDEPTAGVDVSLRQRLWDNILTLRNSGVTVVLTTHYLEEAEMLCRNIGIIDAGQIVEDTSIKRLLATLSRETFILDIEPGHKGATIDGFNHRWTDDHTIEVEVDKDAGLNRVFEQLSEQQVKVLSMRNKANRLEELFVSMVEQGRQKEAAQ